jgi:endonuclease/exonuclease/phosphatase family metal-dependent hydrolase
MNLRVLLLNAENLFLLSDQQFGPEHLKLDEIQWQKLSTSVYSNKPLQKAKALAQVILENKPDLILLCEVGGLESLRNFSQLFLNDQYSAALVEGNSNRNIDVGFLVRKDLGVYFDLTTNKNRSINYLYPHERDSLEAGMTTLGGKPIVSHKFSRDAAELHLFLRDRSRPFMVIVLAHLKSRLDPEFKDPGGFERRQAECTALIEVYQELEQKFEHKVPIMVAGDLNGLASKNNTEAEFKQIYEKTKLEDVCELANLPLDQRATYYQVSRAHRVDGRQIDYCFLSPSLQNYLVKESVRVYRYKDHLGQAFDPPTTLDAKMMLPSDHYPLVFELAGIPVF